MQAQLFLTAGMYDVLVSTSNAANQNTFMPVKGNEKDWMHQRCESAAFIFTGVCEFSFVVLTKGLLLYLPKVSLATKQKVAGCKEEAV